MSYIREQPPAQYTDDWFRRELEKIEQAFTNFDELNLNERNVEPERPRDGMTVFADGTNWNPGSGQGVYTYYAGAWHKLG